MRRHLCSALLALAGLALLAPAATAATPSWQREQTLEQGILREVNRVRDDRGLRSLSLARGLQAAAVYQSRSLLAQGVFDHDSDTGGTFSDRLKHFYPVGASRSWSVGENLLWSQDGIDAPTAVQLWLDSPVHRRILLDPTWREFGAGAVESPSAPGVYSTAGAVVVVTMDFGSRVGGTRVAAQAH